MNPEFEEKVLEVKEGSLIVQDWKGNICEISKAYDVTYLRWAKDFVTRRWIRCPVESWSDWEAMKSRYRADDPTRLFPRCRGSWAAVGESDMAARLPCFRSFLDHAGADGI